MLYFYHQLTRAHKPERLVLGRSCVLVACITSSSTALLGLGSPSKQALQGLRVLEAKEHGRTRRTSAGILVVFQMRTTQLCRAIWLLKPCVSLSTDGTVLCCNIPVNVFDKRQKFIIKSAIQDISYYSYAEYHPCNFLMLTIRKQVERILPFALQ